VRKTGVWIPTPARGGVTGAGRRKW